MSKHLEENGKHQHSNGPLGPSGPSASEEAQTQHHFKDEVLRCCDGHPVRFYSSRASPTINLFFFIWTPSFITYNHCSSIFPPGHGEKYLSDFWPRFKCPKASKRTVNGDWRMPERRILRLWPENCGISWKIQNIHMESPSPRIRKKILQ